MRGSLGVLKETAAILRNNEKPSETSNVVERRFWPFSKFSKYQPYSSAGTVFLWKSCNYFPVQRVVAAIVRPFRALANSSVQNFAKSNTFLEAEIFLTIEGFYIWEFFNEREPQMKIVESPRSDGFRLKCKGIFIYGIIMFFFFCQADYLGFKSGFKVLVAFESFHSLYLTFFSSWRKTLILQFLETGYCARGVALS